MRGGARAGREVRTAGARGGGGKKEVEGERGKSAPMHTVVEDREVHRDAEERLGRGGLTAVPSTVRVDDFDSFDKRVDFAVVNRLVRLRLVGVGLVDQLAELAGEALLGTGARCLHTRGRAGCP